MRLLSTLVMCKIILLVGCSTNGELRDTLIPYEQSEQSSEDLREDYRMLDLVYALPLWEIAPQHRGAFVSEFATERDSEDYFETEGVGAQSAFTVLRLKADLVAVIVRPETEGDVDSITIMQRRSRSGSWKDMTSRVFPYSLPPKSRIRGNRDKTVTVQEPKTPNQRLFRWTGSKYIEAS
jgi:hypothetical protein